MVARGDLGIEIDYHTLPLVQTRIVDLCLVHGKPVIIATHLLESMILAPMPTRAEISDVSTAVRERADAVMLSGETTTGRYPLECVEVMKNIVKTIEPTETRRMNDVLALREPKAKMLRSAAVLAQELGSSGIVVFTRSGFLAYTLAALRAVGVPIYAFTDDEALFRQLLLPWGVEPFLMPFSEDPEKTIQDALAYLKRREWCTRGNVAGDHHQRAGQRQDHRRVAASGSRITLFRSCGRRPEREIGAVGFREPHGVARQPPAVFLAHLEIGPVVDAAVQPRD